MRSSGVGLAEDGAPVCQGAQALEQPLVRKRAEARQKPGQRGGGKGAAERSEERSDSSGEWRKLRDYDGACDSTQDNRGHAQAGVRRPPWATLVEDLDVRRPDLANGTLGGGHHENELVDIEGGSTAVELFSGRQPNAEGVPRRSGVREMIGQRDVGRPCRVGHRQLKRLLDRALPRKQAQHWKDGCEGGCGTRLDEIAAPSLLHNTGT